MHILESHATTNHEKILDSRSTITLAKDENKFKNLRPCKRNMIMVTHVGSKQISHQRKWKEWGETYLAPHTIKNTVSMSRIVAKGYRIVMDTDRENAFFVIDRKSKAIKFPCDIRG